MTKAELISLLEETLAAVKADDSIEGRIAYQANFAKSEYYNVNAFVRVGNSKGQGGAMIVNEEILPS